MSLVSKAWEALTTHGKNIVITTHHGPDGDAIGSCFALAHALQVSGFNAQVVIDKYSPKYEIIDGSKFVFNGDFTKLSCDLLVSVDCGDISRVYAPGGLFELAPVTINIDHHLGNDEFANFNFIDTSAAATAQIVFEIISDFVEIDKNMADALYMGIVTDTGSFKYSATSPRTMQIAAKLIEAGANFTAITQATMYTKTKTEVAIFTTALQNMRFEGQVAYTTISLAEMRVLSARRYDLEGIVEYMRNIDGILASSIICEREGELVKASFRSHSIDVRLIAASLGGGGHKYAAAAEFKSDFETGIQRVLTALKEGVANV